MAAPVAGQNACLFTPKPVSVSGQNTNIGNRVNCTSAVEFARSTLNAGSPATATVFPFGCGYNDNASFTGNAFPNPVQETAQINHVYKVDDVYAAFAGVELQANALYVPPGIKVTVASTEFTTECTPYGPSRVVIRGGLGGAEISSFTGDKRFSNRVMVFKDSITANLGSGSSYTQYADTYSPRPKRCMSSVTMDYDEDVVTSTFQNFLVEHACLGNTSTQANNTITVGGQTLDNYLPSQEPCDSLVATWCKEAANANKPECACFRQQELLNQQFPDFPVPLSPACFGGCVETKAYKTKQFLDQQCNETICSQIVELIGNSISEQGVQELVCDNQVYVIGTSPSIPTVIPNPNPNLGSPVNNPTLYVIIAMGALIFAVVIIFLALYVRHTLRKS